MFGVCLLLFFGLTKRLMEGCEFQVRDLESCPCIADVESATGGKA